MTTCIKLINGDTVSWSDIRTLLLSKTFAYPRLFVRDEQKRRMVRRHKRVIELIEELHHYE